MALHSALSDSLYDDLRAACPSFPDWGEINSNLYPGPDASDRLFAAIALGRSFWKKFQDEIDQKAADKAAFVIFRHFNARCAEWTPDRYISELGPRDEETLGEVRHILWDFFNPGGDMLLGQAVLEEHADFGPGAGPGADDVTFYHKLNASALTAPNNLVVDLFYEWVKSKNSRLDCEISRLMSYGPPEVVVTEITPVPKTTKVSRLVKTEPLLGMFFQKSVQASMEGRLRQYFGINLSDQPAVNAELARVGSVSGEFSTIDLTSASDCISMALCKHLLPSSTFGWLKILRSDCAIAEGKVVPLHMIATMGNAFCFPLQTIIFASIVKAVYRSLGIRFHSGYTNVRCTGDGFVKVTVPATFGVFGDDIVVHREAYESVNRILRYYGFVPNQEKSFTAPSPFRESCGADYYRGFNVRGVYCKSLRTIHDRYVLINNLVEWSARTNIRLYRTIALLLSTVPRIEVPPWENMDAGVRVPFSCIKGTGVFRAVRPTKNGCHYQGSYLYKRWTVKARCYDVDELQRNGGNASAILLLASRGMTQGGKFTARIKGTPLYHLRWAVAPSWDYRLPGTGQCDGSGDWYVIAEGYFRS